MQVRNGKGRCTDYHFPWQKSLKADRTPGPARFSAFESHGDGCHLGLGAFTLAFSSSAESRGAEGRGRRCSQTARSGQPRRRPWARAEAGAPARILRLKWSGMRSGAPKDRRRLEADSEGALSRSLPRHHGRGGLRIGKGQGVVMAAVPCPGLKPLRLQHRTPLC